jgi:hypothetical protein
MTLKMLLNVMVEKHIGQSVEQGLFLFAQPI